MRAVTVALRLWGARAASLGKLPRLTGWQPVLPRKSDMRYGELLLNTRKRNGKARLRRAKSTVSQSVALPFNPREQWDWFPNHVSIRQTAPRRVLETKPFFFSAQFHLPIQLIENPMRCFR
jgi:hypothetical protein